MKTARKIANIRYITGNDTKTIHPCELYDTSAMPGDTAVVHTPRGLLALAKVLSVVPARTEKLYTRDLVIRLDLTDWETHKYRAEQAEKLRADLDRMLADYGEDNVYDLVAEKDPAFKDTLRRLRAMQEGPDDATD